METPLLTMTQQGPWQGEQHSGMTLSLCLEWGLREKAVKLQGHAEDASRHLGAGRVSRHGQYGTQSQVNREDVLNVTEACSSL